MCSHVPIRITTQKCGGHFATGRPLQQSRMMNKKHRVLRKRQIAYHSKGNHQGVRASGPRPGRIKYFAPNRINPIALRHGDIPGFGNWENGHRFRFYGIVNPGLRHNREPPLLRHFLPYSIPNRSYRERFPCVRWHQNRMYTSGVRLCAAWKCTKEALAERTLLA